MNTEIQQGQSEIPDNERKEYAEYSFITAFDDLCREYGGYAKGKEKALELIKRDVQ